jgi:superfamily II DNA/RNA helicase
MMFSATFPRPIQKLAQDFMNQYLWISVGRVGGAVETVEQNVIHVTQDDKPQMLLNLMNGNESMTIIFVAMKRTATWLCRFLTQHGALADDIHGDKEQHERERSLQGFKKGRVRALIATDVASRGLDIRGVERVINYDLPANIDDYVHRIGRTGRIGHRGYAVSLFVADGTSNDIGLAPELVRVLRDAGAQIPPWLDELGSSRKGGRGGKAKGKGSKGKGFDGGKGGYGGKGFQSGKNYFASSGYQQDGGMNGGAGYYGANMQMQQMQQQTMYAPQYLQPPASGQAQSYQSPQPTMYGQWPGQGDGAAAQPGHSAAGSYAWPDPPRQQYLAPNGSYAY